MPPAVLRLSDRADLGRLQAKQSALAKLVMSNQITTTAATPSPSISSSRQNATDNTRHEPSATRPASEAMLPPPMPATVHTTVLRAMADVHSGATQNHVSHSPYPSADTPPYPRSLTSTAPNSPRMPPMRQNSGSHTPRVRPHATTLNIPGMTRSKVSPDGKIAERDVAAKLVIIMVGLPARGKSYITKKIQRYLSWQQHNSRIFNVGNRRRVAAGVIGQLPPAGEAPVAKQQEMDPPTQAAAILLNGQPAPAIEEPTVLDLNDTADKRDSAAPLDQSAAFFNPDNKEASKIRDQVAIDTLDELLDYLLHQGGSVGILDATNSTIKRRQLLVTRIREREPKLGVLFIESICHDQDLLEANMRLKLSGPDYRDKDPVKSLADFKARVKAYESAYEPLGAYEEENQMQYIQLIDVGRKMVQFGLRGFLSGGISSYLTTFNLSPRQIWVTRHGVSFDNMVGKIGGDSELTERGHCYGEALYRFITFKRQEWLVDQRSRAAQATFPPQPGDHTPPYPEPNKELEEKNFCVWTSMLKRSVETAEYFEADDDYDVKAWEMLNELNAGKFEGMTYEEIKEKFPEEYNKRYRDKLNYVYPGVGGEGYLQVISRLRDMVREIERITDHALIIAHRSVCRVLMAYFMDLTRDDIAQLDVPLGMLYSIEPKPYGIDFHAYRYNEEESWFHEVPNYKPQRSKEGSV